MKPCPQCGELNPHEMMMVECDKCLMANIKKIEEAGEPYINKNGLLIPNPEYVRDE